MMHPARLTLLTAAFLGAAGLAHAQPKEPPRAEKVKVEIRYRIRADRDERVRQFIELQKFLTGLGFDDARKGDPDYDLDIVDPTAERFTGTISGTKVFEILGNVRVQSILFAPVDFALPDGDKPVAVKLGLRGGYPLPTQQLLHRQTVAHLAQLGFVESLGYDTRGYTLVRGSIPAKNVETLVKDVRAEPSGWFASNTRVGQLPAPLRDGNPLRWAEVLPVADSAPPFTPAELSPLQLKYSADLRAALADPAAKGAGLRVELVFQNRIDDLDALRTIIQGRYVGSLLEGIIGNVAQVRLARPEYLERIAQEPGVMGVRLPRQAAETTATGVGGKGVSPADAVKAARLDELRRLGYTGAGVKVVLIGSDFAGADKLVGTELPARTRIIDMTAELTADLNPLKPDPTRVGAGVAAAKALSAVAPDVDLVLVRIDPGAFFHLSSVVRLARGEIEYTDALYVRLTELSVQLTAFEGERARAIAAYRSAFADLSDNELAVAARKKTRADLEAVGAREKELVALSARFNAYKLATTTTLRGAQVFVNTLVWESGYPLDALNEIATGIERLTNAPPARITKALPPQPPPLVWVQAASASGAAVWGGPFLDSNGDGLLEFVPPKTKLPADAWSPALNFLGTRGTGGDVTPELAAGARLRIAVQWREPADPNLPETDIPAHALTLRLLRQIDPTGEKRASDEMAEDARSTSVPNLIYRTRTFTVFEQLLEFTVPAAGRYALAVESPAPAEPLLPALRRVVEIYPRIVIDTVGTAAADPKVVFRTFTTPNAGVGTPADALGVVTVGTDAAGALTGAGSGLTLRDKPDVVGPRELAFGGQSASGPGVATGFVGGAAALMVQARASGPNVFRSAGIEAGSRLELPTTWLRIVPPGPARRRP